MFPLQAGITDPGYNSNPLFQIIPPFFARGRNQRRDSSERANDVDEIAEKAEPLERDEGQVPVMFDEEIRKQLDGDRRRQVHDQGDRDNEPDVRPLVREDDGVEAEAAVACAILGSLPDDTKIVDEERPNEDREDGVEGEPHEWIADMVKREDLDEGAGEVEKIVHELERPADKGEGVNAGPRPEKQDDEERNRYVRPGGNGAMRDDFAGVLGQEGERHTLDDAGQGQLDINNHFVELAAAGGRGFHKPSGSRSGGSVSIPGVVRPKATPPSEFRRNLTREPAGKTDL